MELEQFGLTKTESRVYISLLKLGSTSSGPLVKKTELHRATVYDVLKRLMEKGLVNFVIKGKTKFFEATKPEHFLDILDEEKINLEKKEKSAKELVKELMKIHESAQQKQEAHVFVGKKAVKTVLEEVLENKEYVTFGSMGGAFHRIMGPYFEQFQIKKRKLKVKSRIILPIAMKGSMTVKRSYAKFKYLPESFGGLTNTFVFGNKVAIFIWTENPMCFLIENKDVADAYLRSFEVLWGIAKQ